MSRARAIERWPDKADLFKSLDHGRADAANLAIAGMIREGRLAR